MTWYLTISIGEHFAMAHRAGLSALVRHIQSFRERPSTHGAPQVGKHGDGVSLRCCGSNAVRNLARFVHTKHRGFDIGAESPTIRA